MGEKPFAGCILCAVRDGSSEVARLEVFRGEGFIISVNLYPYTSGHIIVFPEQHISDLRDLTAEEAATMHSLTIVSMGIIDRLYSPAGYNVGFNIGHAGGASISHLHRHVVPRYGKELGVVDILSGSKIIIENPRETHRKLTEAFEEVSEL